MLAAGTYFLEYCKVLCIYLLKRMTSSPNRLEVEAAQHRENNQALSSHLETLRSRLTTAFTSLPLPGITLS